MLLFQHVNVSGVNAHQCVEADVEVGEPSLLQGGQPPGEGHSVRCHPNRLQTVGSNFHINFRHMYGLIFLDYMRKSRKTSSPEVQEEPQVSPRWRLPLLSQEAPLLSTGSEN